MSAISRPPLGGACILCYITPSPSLEFQIWNLGTGGREISAISRPPIPSLEFQILNLGTGGVNSLLYHAPPSLQFKIQNLGTKISTIIPRTVIHYKLGGHLLFPGLSPNFLRMTHLSHDCHPPFFRPNLENVLLVWKWYCFMVKSYHYMV